MGKATDNFLPEYYEPMDAEEVAAAERHHDRHIARLPCDELYLANIIGRLLRERLWLLSELEKARSVPTTE